MKKNMNPVAPEIKAVILKDKAWESIDLNEVSADEKGTAGYDVRLVADAFG